MKKSFFFKLLILLLPLSACTVSVPVELNPALLQRWEAHQQVISQQQHWQLRASMAANSEDDGWNARVFWQQAGEAYELRLQGPMGQGAVRLQGDAQGVVMYTGGEVYRAATPEALLDQQASIRLPLVYLRYWVRGLPVPDIEIQTRSFTPEGQLSQIQQAGWNITFARYKSVEGLSLPHKIRLENALYVARIGISKWQLETLDSF